MLLEHKVAVVTGAASGMGEATCRRFAAEGAQVVALDLNPGGAEAVVDQIREGGARDPLSFQVDVASPESVEAVFSKIGEQTAGTDILVNCAGIREIVSPLELDHAEWSRVVGVNLDGTFLCCQAAARQMKDHGRGGSVINISSTAGIRGYENRPAYSASKAGVVGLTMSLARDLGPLGIRVNCICPGLTRTPFTEMYFESEELVRNIPRVVPLGHAAAPDQLAGAILFLASDLGAYVSGATLPVDGGHTIVATFNLSGDDDSPFSAKHSISKEQTS